MYERRSAKMQQSVTDLDYYDGQTWKRLDPQLVEKGEHEELDRFKKMRVYEYVVRKQSNIRRVARLVKSHLWCSFVRRFDAVASSRCRHPWRMLCVCVPKHSAEH